MKQEDLAIFVSFTGETKGILSYAQIAQRQQVPIISIISTKGSNLEKLSTISLYAKGTTRYHHSVDLSSRISVICLFDTVLLMYADQMKTISYNLLLFLVKHLTQSCMRIQNICLLFFISFS